MDFPSIWARFGVLIFKNQLFRGKYQQYTDCARPLSVFIYRKTKHDRDRPKPVPPGRRINPTGD